MPCLINYKNNFYKNKCFILQSLPKTWGSTYLRVNGPSTLFLWQITFFILINIKKSLKTNWGSKHVFHFLMFNVWIHDERYSKHDLIINSDIIQANINDLLELTFKEKTILLKVTEIDKESKQLQISIAQHIAHQLDIVARSAIKVRKIIGFDSIAIDTMEIAFRDQYIGFLGLIKEDLTCGCLICLW